MDERGANIDLLFRNGLKDYEVLPPQDVWDNIRPVIRKNRFSVFLRYAAAVAVIVSLSFTVWMLNRDVNEEIPGSVAVFSIPHSNPVMLAGSRQTDADSPSQTPVRSDDIFVPVKAGYNSEIIVLDRSGDRSSFPVEDFTAPEKAAVTPVTENFFIENIGNDFPEYYPNVKFTDNRWSISAMMSPTYHSKTGTTSEEFMRMAATENVTASYSGGVGLSYRISRRFTVQTGLYYAKYGQKIEGVTSYAGFKQYAGKNSGSGNFEVLTTNGSIRASNGDVFLAGDEQAPKVLTSPAYHRDVFDPNKENLSNTNEPLIQKFSYIQMPVIVRYKVIDRNIDINLMGGVSYDFLVGNNASAGGYRVGETEGLNTLIFSSSVGMGVEYNFSEKVSLNLEPTLRYYLNPFNNSVGTNIHPYSFGVFSGFSFKF